MIPMGRDAVPLTVYRRVVTDDRGDVTESWVRTEHRAMVSAYPLSSSRMQTEDGQDVQALYRLLLCLPSGAELVVGDRLGDSVGAVWHLTEVKQGPGHLSCIGRRL